MKTILIVNPQSGGGRTGRTLSQLLRALSSSFHSDQTLVTKYPGHGIELARKAASDGFHKVIAVGGDGTVNEVINGLMKASEDDKLKELPLLGMLPQGTGGDFRKNFFKKHSFSDYLTALHSENVRSLDIGKASFLDHQGKPASRYFVNILSVGLGGLVDQYASEDNSRASSGKMTYLKASVKAFVRSSLAKLKCTYTAQDAFGEEKEKVVLLHSRNIAICNGQYFGGGMRVAPLAKIDDGLFDIVNFATEKRWQLLKIGKALQTGSHLKLPQVQSFRTSKI